VVQHILEERVAQSNVVLDRETGMGEIKSLKLAAAKIRSRIHKGTWQRWDGWIPTRHVHISQIDAEQLLSNVMPQGDVPIRSFANFNETPIQFDGPRLNMVNVITGVKGSGKSHLAKHLVLALAEQQVPCVIFDINGEYTGLPNVQVLRWGDNFTPDLAEVGFQILPLIIRAIYPLPETSENAFEVNLPTHFTRRRQWCESRGQRFTIDLDYLRNQRWSGQDLVQQAILGRLRVIEDRGLFLSNDGTSRNGQVTNFEDVYEEACQGYPIVFDMRTLNSTLQRALVTSIYRTLEQICIQESGFQGRGRFPFVFFEEAHFYISDSSILNIVTRGRHIGMASVFVTNTPQ
jgi:hypothetical protein